MDQKEAIVFTLQINCHAIFCNKNARVLLQKDQENQVSSKLSCNFNHIAIKKKLHTNLITLSWVECGLYSICKTPDSWIRSYYSLVSKSVNAF